MSQNQILLFLQQMYPNKYSIAQLIYHLKNQGLAGSVIYANVKKLREKGEIAWGWGEYLSKKSRPARYYWSKTATVAVDEST